MDVSIIIPYNKDRGYLNEAIASCENQEFDGTYEIIPYFGEQIVSKNFNQAMGLAKGDCIKICHENDLLRPCCLQDLYNGMARGRFIKLMAEDDILLPNCIADLYNGIENYDVVCAYVWEFNTKMERPYYSQKPLNLRALCIDNTIHGLSVMYRRSSLEKIAVAPGEYMRETWNGKPLDCAEEYELHLRMLKAGMRIGLVKSFVGRYRLHEWQKSLGVKVHQGERIKERFDTIMSIKRFYDKT